MTSLLTVRGQFVLPDMYEDVNHTRQSPGGNRTFDMTRRGHVAGVAAGVPQLT